jgi:hypothetical protein
MSGTRWVAVVALATALAGGIAQDAIAGAKSKCHGVVVKTSAPTKVTPVSAVLHGSVNTCGTKRVTVSFAIGGRAVGSHSAPADKRSHTFSYSLSSLTPGEVVSYRLQAKVGHKIVSAKGSLRTSSILVTTQAATSVGTGSAVLNASVDGNGAAGLKVAFTWSISGGRQQLLATGTALPPDRVSHSFSATLTGLSPATKYTFDTIVIGPKGTLAQCGCGLTFTTSPVLTGVHVTAPAAATAGQSFDVSAAGIGTGGVSLGDVTSHTVFTITPDGSCTGASCSATVAGPHTIQATDGAFSDTAPTTVDPGPVSSLKLSPASGTACEEFTATNAEVSCPVLGPTQAYTAEGYDQYNNDIGDVTASTIFTGGAGCEGPNCSIGSDPGPDTITGTDGTATGTASLTGSTPNMTCEGAHYDVDDDISDGCEVTDAGVGVGTKSEADGDPAAASAPECDSGTNADIDISGTIPSDTRVHKDPAITGFDPTTGSVPDWFWISPIVNELCENDLVMTLTTSGEGSSASNDCYELTVDTDTKMYAVRTSSDGTASIDQDMGGQWDDPSHIDVEVSKACGANVTEDVSWTLSGHL